MQDIDKEKLRAFEQKMRDEGADGFADGPAPWETWDESGAQAGNGRHVWEGKARRIYKTAPLRRTLGDRILSSLATIAFATMIVGIVGVYLTEEKPQTVAWTAVQPTPIPLPRATDSKPLPARVTRSAPVIAEIESLPSPAAGSTTRMIDRDAVKTAAGSTPFLADAETEATGDATTPADNPVADVPADDSPWEPVGNDPNVEIVTEPAALLLTSRAASSQDSDYDAASRDMDPELAMEIAIAPSVDDKMADEPVATTDMTTQEPVATATASMADTDSAMEAVIVPATDRINRGTTTAGTSAANNTLPENDTAIAQDTGNQGMAATEVAVLESLSPSAAGPAATATATANRELPDEDATRTTGATASENTVVALAEPEPVVDSPSPAASAAEPRGDWVVNLASYTYESMARKKLAVFQAKGVTGEIEPITVNGKPMYRIRVTGFESSRAARASIPELQKKLGLEGAWIAKR